MTLHEIYKDLCEIVSKDIALSDVEKYEAMFGQPPKMNDVWKEASIKIRDNLHSGGRSEPSI